MASGVSKSIFRLQNKRSFCTSTSEDNNAALETIQLLFDTFIDIINPFESISASILTDDSSGVN